MRGTFLGEGTSGGVFVAGGGRGSGSPLSVQAARRRISAIAGPGLAKISTTAGKEGREHSSHVHGGIVTVPC